MVTTTEGSLKRARLAHPIGWSAVEKHENASDLDDEKQRAQYSDAG